MSMFNLIRPQTLLKSVNPLYSGVKTGTIARQANVALYATRPSKPRGLLKLTLISVGVGSVFGVGYSAYTHYQINQNHASKPAKDLQTLILEQMPDVKPTRKVSPHFVTCLLMEMLVLFSFSAPLFP